MLYEVWVHTPDYTQRTAIIAEEGEGWIFSSLKIPRKENQITQAILTMPYQAGVIELFPLDTRLEFYENGRLELETQWFVRVPPKLIYGDDGLLYIEIRALCALYLVSGRIVAYPAGSPQAVKSGPADDVIKAIVRENLGTLASADRDLSDYLDVEADTSQGSTVHKTMPRQNVLLVCQKIARSSAQAGVPIFFDVVWTPSTHSAGSGQASSGQAGRLEFRTYAQQREHARTLVLAPSFGTLAESSRSFDHREEATVIYCAGQGQGALRVIVSVSDDARRTMTPFNRREVFVDARYLSLTQSVATEADATLWRRRPVQELGGVAVDTPQVVYGYSWFWGDLLLTEDNGESFPVRVYGITIEVKPGWRRVMVELRADSTEADDAVRRIEGQLDNSASDELPIFSVEPIASGVPVAADDGFIEIGWLNPADLPTGASGAAGGDLSGSYPTPTVRGILGSPIEHVEPDLGAVFVWNDGEWSLSNVSGIAGVQEAPAAYKVPKAGSDGVLQDGWLSVAIARLAQLTWGNITGKPSTFPPGGTAGGDLVSNYPNPLVKGLRGRALSSNSPIHGDAYRWNEDLQMWTPQAIPIFSYSMTVPSFLTVDPGTFAGSGTFVITLNTQAANTVFAGPSSGAATAPTFRPLAAADMPTHASTHQNGGGDEIATATPAANAIPKAGAGSTLADSWLSPAIARVSQLTWTDITGKPSTFTPSTHASTHAAAGADPVTPAAIGASAVGHAHAATDIASGLLAVARGGTGVGAMPAFLVHKNGVNQTGIAHNTSTLITWSTEVFDTAGNFASNRFMPTVAGKYLLIFVLSWNSTADQTYIVPRIYKNGVFVAQFTGVASGTIAQGNTLITIQSANGSGDYFETYAYQNSGVARDVYGDSTSTFFAGVWMAP